MQGKNDIKFQYGTGPYRVRDQAVPESAVAYKEDYLQEQIAVAGLQLSGPIYYGSWSGQTTALSYQDIIILRPTQGA